MATKTKNTTSVKAGVKAPAKKTSAKAKASSEKKVATKNTKTTASVAKAKTITKAATAAKKTKKAPVSVIKLVVTHDVGFGNKLFIRGDAPGLTWDKGVEMENTASDEWVWRGNRTTKAYEVKVLINDQCWDVGENIVLGGKKVVHVPKFE